MDGKFSEAELKLLRHFNCETLAAANVSDYQVYQVMVCNAFVRKDNSPAADALRRCFQALLDCTHPRGTTEFDALATFDDPLPRKRGRKK